MGLDQYLYRTTRKDFNRDAEFRNAMSKYNAAVKAALDAEEHNWTQFFDSLPKDKSGNYDFGRFTPEQETKRQEYIQFSNKVKKRFADEFGLELDDRCFPKYPEDIKPCDEVYYWRKNWNLHNFIVEHFLEDKSNDNLVRIVLGREELELLSKSNYDPELFSQLLSEFDDKYVVFYYPWY